MATAFFSAGNTLRTNFYNNYYKQYFEYKVFNEDGTPKADLEKVIKFSDNIYRIEPDFIYPNPINENITNRGNIERSYDYDYVRLNLIDPLLNKFKLTKKQDKLFHYYIKYNVEALQNKYSFAQSILFVYSNLIKHQSILFRFRDGRPSVNLNDTEKSSLQEFIFKNYLNKRIDGIEINNEYIKFKYPLTRSDMEKLRNDDNIKHSGSPLNMYLYYMCNNGFFNFYNHIIDVSNECTKSRKKKFSYYCNKLKIGAIKILLYYFLSDILKEFILARKETHPISLTGSSVYAGTVYGNASKFIDSDFEGTPLKLKESVTDKLKYDIANYWEIQLSIISTLSIEDSLISQKNFKSLQIFDDITNNENILNTINQKNEKTKILIDTLVEKNDVSLNTIKRNKIILVLFAILVILYIILNIVILSDFVKVSKYIVSLVNTIILIIMIIYIFINILKKIYF